jgi:hypothetical protein
MCSFVAGAFIFAGEHTIWRVLGLMLTPGIGIPLRWEEYNRPTSFNSGWLRLVLGGVALCLAVVGLIWTATKLLPSPTSETARFLTKLFWVTLWFAWMIFLRRHWKKLSQQSKDLQSTSTAV